MQKFTLYNSSLTICDNVLKTYFYSAKILILDELIHVCFFFQLTSLHQLFQVAVNNQHLLEFNHRVQPLNMIDTLRIDGDVRLTQVRIQG